MTPIRTVTRFNRLIGAFRSPPALCAAFAAAFASTAAASGSSGVPDGSSVEILLRDGNWMSGRLEAIDETGWTLSRPGGAADATRMVPQSDIVACLVGSERRRSLAFLTQFSVGTLVLADGQFLPGTLRTDARPPYWEHRWIGSVPLSTDALTEIRLSADRRAPQRPDADTVLFVNGDLAAGFIESIGAEIVLEPIDADVGSDAAAERPSDETQPSRPEQAAQQAPSKRRIQIERVAAMTFAALERPAVSDALLWTVDGSIVRAKELSYGPEGGWRFLLADVALLGGREPKPIGNAVTKPTAILFDRTSMTPLVESGQPEREPRAATYRYEATPQVRMETSGESLLGLGSVELDGPLHIRFDPPAALRGTEGRIVFSADIALREPVPADARTTVVVRFGGSGEETVALDADNRRASVRLTQGPSRDSALEILVDDGGNGVAGDRIVIHRGCFLLQP